MENISSEIETLRNELNHAIEQYEHPQKIDAIEESLALLLNQQKKEELNTRLNNTNSIKEYITLRLKLILATIVA